MAISMATSQWAWHEYDNEHGHERGNVASSHGMAMSTAIQCIVPEWPHIPLRAMDVIPEWPQSSPTLTAEWPQHGLNKNREDRFHKVGKLERYRAPVKKRSDTSPTTFCIVGKNRIIRQNSRSKKSVKEVGQKDELFWIVGQRSRSKRSRFF